MCHTWGLARSSADLQGGQGHGHHHHHHFVAVLLKSRLASTAPSPKIETILINFIYSSCLRSFETI